MELDPRRTVIVGILVLFLTMAMMGLRFWEVGDQALFIFTSLLLQVLMVTLFAVFIVFRVLGKNYDAAVITAGYLGSSLGATPTAMAKGCGHPEIRRLSGRIHGHPHRCRLHHSGQ